MIKLIRVTVALFMPLISLTAFSYGADVSSNLSVNVVPPEATGGCGTPSPYVPAGYTCKTAASDEFNGTTLDSTKWKDLANTSLRYVSGGVLHMQYAPDGSNGGIMGTGNNGSGDAPFYLETRTRWPTGEDTGGETNWPFSSDVWQYCSGTGNCGELDVDQRFCANQDINVWAWRGGGNTWDGAGYTGTVGCLGNSANMRDGNFHILGVQVW